MTTKMTFKIDTEKLKKCEFQTPASLEHSIEVCLKICGLTPTGNLTFTSKKPWQELDTDVFLEFEEYGEILDYLAEWTIEWDGHTRDALTIYNECRKPFYERILKPRRDAEKRQTAEEHIKRLKNKTTNNE